MSDPLTPQPSVRDALRVLASALYLDRIVGAVKTAASFATPIAAWLALALAVAPHFGGCSLPLPPGPSPGPNVKAPIDLDGLAVLVVEDKRQNMPRDQQAVYTGKAFRDLLTSKCMTDPATGKAAWWVLDKGDDASDLPKPWQDALRRALDKSGGRLPWIMVSNPRKGGGYEGPSPKSNDEAAALVGKFVP